MSSSSITRALCPSREARGAANQDLWITVNTAVVWIHPGQSTEESTRSAGEHFGGYDRLGVGDAQVAGALVRQGEEAADPARDGVLGQGRVGQGPQLLQGRLLVLQAQGPRAGQVPRGVGTQDL